LNLREHQDWAETYASIRTGPRLNEVRQDLQDGQDKQINKFVPLLAVHLLTSFPCPANPVNPVNSPRMHQRGAHGGGALPAISQ